MILQNSPKQAIARFVFAHGAGAGMQSEFMQKITDGLVEQGVEVLRFDFDYMRQAKQLGKKRPPDKLEKLQACFLKQLAKLDDSLALFIGGKSMGGRVASSILDQSAAQAAICLGYPFHPPGKPDKLRTEHLQQLQKPLLIVQGQRDTFGNQNEACSYTLSNAIQLAFLADGDHSFKPRKSSGINHSDNIKLAVKTVANFIQERV